MAELIPNYELTEEHFMEVIKDRIYQVRFRYTDGGMGGICWPDSSKKSLDNKGGVQFDVGLNGRNPLETQAVSLAHEVIHIDHHAAFMSTKVYASYEQMRADEELFVQERTTQFLEQNSSLTQAGVNYLKIKHGEGIQLPLIPESFYSLTA